MAFDIFLSVVVICVYIFTFWKLHKLIAKNIDNRFLSVIVGTCIGIALALLFISVTHNNEILNTAVTRDAILVKGKWMRADHLLIIGPAFYAMFRMISGDKTGKEKDTAEKERGRPHKTFGQAVYDTVTSPIFAFIIAIVIAVILGIKFFGDSLL